MNRKPIRVEVLGDDDVAEVVSVLSEAFLEYPVMRYVLGEVGDYRSRLETLLTFFTRARVLRGEAVLGIREADSLSAVALVSSSGSSGGTAELSDLREATWARLGGEARARYETFGEAANAFVVEAPHHHLNMVGVRRVVQGRGYGRALLGSVHDLSVSSAQSAGVTLTTEVASNVLLYEHFGYELLGGADVAGTFKTWAMYRRNSSELVAQAMTSWYQ